MVIKSFQMPIGNGHWESNFFNGFFSPIVVENNVPWLAPSKIFQKIGEEGGGGG